MKSARTLNILSLVFNILIVGLFSFVNSLNGGSISQSFHLFNIDAATILTLFAFISIPFNIIGIIKCKRLPTAIYVLKLVGTASILTSMVFSIGVLGYMNGFDLNAIFGGFDFLSPTVYLNLVIPVIAIIGFVFFDHTEKAIFPVVFFALIPASLYASFYQANVMQQIQEFNGTYDWYNLQSLGQTGAVIALAIMIVASLVIAIIIYLLNRLLGKAFFKAEPVKEVSSNNVEEQPEKKTDDSQEENVLEKEDNNQLVEEEVPAEEPEEKEENNELVEEESSEEEEESEIEEPQKEEEPVEEEKPAKKPAGKKPAAKKPAPAKKPAKEADSSSSNNGTKVYHLTKRKEDGMWAITFVGGKKPVKLFKTKKEAEEYLAILTKNQGATALIRNSKGAKAGKFASSIKSDEDKK